MPDEPDTPLDERPVTRFVVDGREYASVEAMPPEMQKVYGRAVAARSGLSRDPDAPTLEIVENEDGATTTRIVRTARPEESEARIAGEEVDPDDLPPAIRETYERLMAGEHRSKGPAREGNAADPWIEEEAHEVLLGQQSRWSGSFGRSGGSNGSMARTVINLLVMALCLAVLGLLFQLG